MNIVCVYSKEVREREMRKKLLSNNKIVLRISNMGLWYIINDSFITINIFFLLSSSLTITITTESISYISFTVQREIHFMDMEIITSCSNKSPLRIYLLCIVLKLLFYCSSLATSIATQKIQSIYSTSDCNKVINEAAELRIARKVGKHAW